jgi:hypothetical protein
MRNIIQPRVTTTKSDAKIPSEASSYVDEIAANKPKSRWRKGDETVFKKKTRSSSNNKEIKLQNNLDVTNLSLKSDIYPKWWGEKPSKPIAKRKKKKNDSSNDSRKKNPLKYSENTNSSQQDESFYARKQRLEKRDIIQQKQVAVASVDKRFNKRKPSTGNISNSNVPSRNKEEPKIIMSFDMSTNSRFPLARNNRNKNDSSASQSKNKLFSDNSIDKTPESRKHKLRKTESVDSKLDNKPIRARSKIKDHLEKDKKLFNLLKQSNYNNDAIFNSGEEQIQEEVYNRNNKMEENNPKSNFLIEFDKNLDVQNIREKSHEKKQIVVPETTSKKLFSHLSKPRNLIEDENFEGTYKKGNVVMNISRTVSNINKDENNNSFYNNLSYEKSNVSHLDKEKKNQNANNNNFGPMNESISFINKLQNISAEIQLKNNNSINQNNRIPKHAYINSKYFCDISSLIQ